MSEKCQERTHALQQKGRRGPLPLLANFDVAFYPSLPAGHGGLSRWRQRRYISGAYRESASSRRE